MFVKLELTGNNSARWTNLLSPYVAVISLFKTQLVCCDEVTKNVGAW